MSLTASRREKLHLIIEGGTCQRSEDLRNCLVIYLRQLRMTAAKAVKNPEKLLKKLNLE
jgi:hypothetical protein